VTQHQSTDVIKKVIMLNPYRRSSVRGVGSDMAAESFVAGAVRSEHGAGTSMSALSSTARRLLTPPRV
jgi:hypothetical protein